MTKRILVADDHDVNATVLTAMLKGYKVERARNGNEVLAMCAANPPDLILMDLEMPELDGWEATRQLRLRPEMLMVPIIATSAHTNVDDWETAKLAGCTDCITKPYETQEVRRVVAKYLFGIG